MVVRNEADFLHACLRTTTPVVGEVILVDTGSTDETPRIGAGYGAKIYSFTWKNDFSAARNFSLQQATKPWVLVMDADEVLSPQDYHKLALLLEASSRGVVVNSSISVAYSLTQRNYLKGSGQITWDQSWTPNSHEYQEGQGYPGYLDVPVVRLFPRLRQIVYSGVVHESVEDSLAQSGFPHRILRARSSSLWTGPRLRTN